MTKEVLIHVKGLQAIGGPGEEDPIEMILPGEYYYRNGSHYLRYEEMAEEDREKTVNYIKISPKGMEVRKKGGVDVHMVFEEGKKNLTYYSTPFGSLQIGIAATHMNFEEKEESLGIKVDYSLDLNERYVADCFLTIEAESKNSTNLTLTGESSAS